MCCLWSDMPLEFNPTNSPDMDKALASRSRCSGITLLPVSDIADIKFYIQYKGQMKVREKTSTV